MNTNDFDYGSFVQSDLKKKEVEKAVLEANEEIPVLEAPSKKKKAPKKLENSKERIESLKDKSPKTKKLNKSEIQKSRVVYPIGVKLILIISAIVSISMALVIFLASYYVSKDTRISAEENNLTINSRSASDVESRFSAYSSAVGMLYDSFTSDDEEEEMQYKAERFFERNDDVVAISLIEDGYSFCNKSYFISREINFDLVDAYLAQENEAVDSVKNGETVVLNATPFFGNQLLAIFTQIRSDNDNDIVMIIVSADALSDTFSTGSTNLSFLVNADGTILLHPDLEIMQNASDFSSHPLVEKLFSEKTDNEQVTYRDSENIEYIGAYKKLNIGGCAVVTEVQVQIVLEAVNATTRRNIYLTIAVLSIAIMIVWFFSKSLSIPLKDLTAITDEINAGNFETALLSQIKNKRKDEIGVLIESTKAEQDILNTFTRLTNKGVTRAIVTKKIDFQPHLKDITIFFSDIRGFTAISDGFNKRFGEKSAAEIIGFLNDYMGRMVNCITITGGTVDKFEGDAIMACWGVLRDDSLDFEKLPDTDPRKAKFKAVHEKHIKYDALSAIKATTAMRYALMEYNKKAELFTKKHEGEPLAKYKPHIRIGSGLNSGRATVGFMGSYDKMEFTSIGDAVNLASRTESSNKPCGTDMLITEDTYNLLKMDYIRCEENNFTIKPENLKNEVIVEVIPVTFEVKGKGKQHFYGVVNMPQFNIEEFFRKTNPKFKVDPDCAKAIGPKGPKTLAEVRTILGIPTPDFGGVNLDAEESKIKAT